MNVRSNYTFSGMFLALYYFLLSCIFVLPRFSYKFKYVYIIILTIPFVLLYGLSKKIQLQRILIFLGGLAIIFIFSFLVNTPLSINQSINTSILTYLTFFPYFMFDYLQGRNNEKTNKMVLVLISLLYIYVSYKTFRALMTEPTVVRMLASGDNSDPYIVSLRNNNVGGYGYAYAIGMLVPYLSVKFMTNKKPKTRLMIFALLVVSFVICIYAQYTTLLIMSFVTIVLVFAFYSKNIILKSSIIIGGILSLLFVQPIFKLLATYLPFESLAYHFNTMYLLLTTNEETLSRLNYTKVCLMMFLKHPIFGSDMTNSYYEYYINHGHTTYVPLLAKHGIVGFGIYFSITIYVIKSIINKAKSKELLPVYIFYVVLGFLNPNSTLIISIMVFLIIPILELIVNNSKENALYGNTQTL